MAAGGEKRTDLKKCNTARRFAGNGTDRKKLVSSGQEEEEVQHETGETQPRPSLAGDGKVSATSSVLNVVGHKDEALCRYLAERAAAVHRCNAVCTGGFHVDNMTGAQIEELLAAVKELEI